MVVKKLKGVFEEKKDDIYMVMYVKKIFFLK